MLKVFLVYYHGVLETLIYINLVTIILFPEGMYDTFFTENFFLGYDNVSITFILPALCVSILYSYLKYDKISWRTIALIIGSFATVFLRKIATSEVMMMILIAYLIVPRIFRNTKIFNIFNYIIINIIAFLAIVIGRVQDYFSFLIVDVLGKSLTFTGRTRIWDRNISYIKQNWLGYGYEEEAIRKLKNDGFAHAHNQILEVLYQGGILLLLSFASIFYFLGKSLMRFKEHKYAKVTSLFVFMVMISMLMEVFRTDYFWIIYMVAYHIGSIILQERKEKVEV